jgi:hypothetical protein
MKVVATLISYLDESFEGRRPDVIMIRRYLSSRINRGSINEENYRGKVVMNISSVQTDVMEVD